MTSTFKIIAAATIAISVCAGSASAEPRRGGNLLPPVSAACISSPFGPRVLPNQPGAGSYHYRMDLPAPVGAPVMATAPGTVIRLQNKGPGGLEMLVQHDGFVGIYGHFSMVTPAFAEGKRTIAAGEQLGAVGITGVTSGAHLYFEWTWLESLSIRHRTSSTRTATGEFAERCLEPWMPTAKHGSTTSINLGCSIPTRRAGTTIGNGISLGAPRPLSDWARLRIEVIAVPPA